MENYVSEVQDDYSEEQQSIFMKFFFLSSLVAFLCGINHVQSKYIIRTQCQMQSSAQN